LAEPADYDRLNQGDALEFTGLRTAIESGAEEITAKGGRKGY
jgi:hypothetical protein